jgi:structural maintenance of chromosome 3 (chondroitin sulfate proteoglycan 6)
VVETDGIASRILDQLNKEKGGRVTFMPLNRLHPKPVDYPSTDDVIPMIDKLKFDPKHKKAFQQIFGKAVICPQLEVAAVYARTHNLNAVTLDGKFKNFNLKVIEPTAKVL